MNEQEREQWLRQGEAGDADGWFQLGLAYAAGDGVEANTAQAGMYYARAAELGHASAMNNLGIMFLNGDGVPQDQARAAKCFGASASLGEVNAMFNFGLAHENGWGVPVDLAEAIVWMERAAQAGHANAGDALARLRPPAAGDTHNGVIPEPEAQPEPEPAPEPEAEPPPGPRPEGPYLQPPNPAQQRKQKAGTCLYVVAGIAALVAMFAYISTPEKAPWRLRILTPGGEAHFSGSFSYYQGDDDKYTPLNDVDAKALAAGAEWKLPQGISIVRQQITGKAGSVSWRLGNTRYTADGASFHYDVTFACDRNVATGTYPLRLALMGMNGNYLDSGVPVDTYIAGELHVAPSLAAALGPVGFSLALFGTWIPLAGAGWFLHRRARRSRPEAVVEPDEIMAYRQMFNNTKTGEVVFDLGATRRALYWNGDRIPREEITAIRWNAKGGKLVVVHRDGHAYALHAPLGGNVDILNQVAQEVSNVAGALEIPFEDKGKKG